MQNKKTKLRFYPTLMLLVVFCSSQQGIAAEDWTTEAGPCPRPCSWAEIPDRLQTYAVIDANTGRMLSGSVEFSKRSQIQLIFVNKNPFKYLYRFEITSSPLEQSIISTALGLFSLTGLLSKEQTDARPEGVFDIAKGECDPSADSITHFQKAKNSLTDARKAASAVLEYLAPIIQTLRSAGAESAYNAFLEGIQTNPTQNTCINRCTMASSLEKKLDEVDDFGVFDADQAQHLVSDLTDAVNRLNEDINKLGSLEGPLGDGCDQAVIGLREDLAELVAGRDDAIDAIDQLRTLSTAFADMKMIISSVFAMSQPFVEVRYPTTSGKPTQLDIVIIRRNRLIKESIEERVAVPPIMVGKSRFSLSLGVGISFHDVQKVVRQAGQVMGGSGDSTVDTVFGYEENSSYQLVGAVQLNARLARLWNGNEPGFFGWSTGIGLDLSGAANLGFYTGPSLSLLDDQLFFTFAVHIQKVESLAGGFEIGEPVPPELPDPIPMTKETKAALFLGVTYRVK